MDVARGNVSSSPGKKRRSRESTANKEPNPKRQKKTKKQTVQERYQRAIDAVDSRFGAPSLTGPDAVAILHQSLPEWLREGIALLLQNIGDSGQKRSVKENALILSRAFRGEATYSFSQSKAHLIFGRSHKMSAIETFLALIKRKLVGPDFASFQDEKGRFYDYLVEDMVRRGLDLNGPIGAVNGTPERSTSNPSCVWESTPLFLATKTDQQEFLKAIIRHPQFQPTIELVEYCFQHHNFREMPIELIQRCDENVIGVALSDILGRFVTEFSIQRPVVEILHASKHGFFHGINIFAAYHAVRVCVGSSQVVASFEKKITKHRAYARNTLKAVKRANLFGDLFVPDLTRMICNFFIAGSALPEIDWFAPERN